MKEVTIVISRLRLIIVCVLLIGALVLNFLTPKNVESNKMIVEYGDGETCEVLLWNDDELVARLYSVDGEQCKFYLIKNSSR